MSRWGATRGRSEDLSIGSVSSWRGPRHISGSRSSSPSGGGRSEDLSIGGIARSPAPNLHLQMEAGYLKIYRSKTRQISSSRSLAPDLHLQVSSPSGGGRSEDISIGGLARSPAPDHHPLVGAARERSEDLSIGSVSSWRGPQQTSSSRSPAPDLP